MGERNDCENMKENKTKQRECERKKRPNWMKSNGCVRSALIWIEWISPSRSDIYATKTMAKSLYWINYELSAAVASIRVCGGWGGGTRRFPFLFFCANSLTCHIRCTVWSLFETSTPSRSIRRFRRRFSFWKMVSILRARALPLFAVIILYWKRWSRLLLWPMPRKTRLLNNCSLPWLFPSSEKSKRIIVSKNMLPITGS